MVFDQPLSIDTLVSAAVSVVLPWSTWPIVPTLQWGLVRRNFSLAMGLSSVAWLSVQGCAATGAARAGRHPEPLLRSGPANAVSEDETVGQARGRAGADMGDVSP